MFYKILLCLITNIYIIIGAPIHDESLKFRLIRCIEGENETLSNHVLEITNFNETCIKVNKSSSEGNQVYLYIAPQTENGVELHITTDNCSQPLPDLHLTVCDDKDTFINYTEVMITYQFNNITNIDLFNETNQTSTPDTFIYTGPTVYETLHRLNQDSDEEQDNITNKPSINNQDSQSTEEQTKSNFI